MASGALPPGFPMVKIGTDYFWDGGIVSNTPLQHLLAQDDDLNSLVFQVDLFSARGALPRTIQDVMGREKDIVYSSRTRQVTDMFQRLQRWKTSAPIDALVKVPEADLTDEERAMRDKLAKLPAPHHPAADLSAARPMRATRKDYEFSAHVHARALAERLRGHQAHPDAQGLAGHAAGECGIVTHDMHRDREEAVW